ncbi:anaphase-promoting complex subunit 15-like [Rhopilema esculentum]|uniref:anaphase-promoting complex subunit 15-like n=1 Tax=Rhopilema esculentum TaxID=499914 RepID=UPI0031E000DB
MAYVFFPNSKPSLVDDIWFQVDKKVDEDAQLSKDEDEYYKKLQKEINRGKDIIPIGKTKEQHTVTEVDEEDVDEEESVEELEDDTDEFDTASPEVGSVDEEVEMADASGQNNEGPEW